MISNHRNLDLQGRSAETILGHLAEMGVDVEELRKEGLNMRELNELYYGELAYKFLELMADASDAKYI